MIGAPEPLVRVVNLRKTFGANRVLDAVGLAVAAGEAVALLGANGAGKTTLLKILATLQRPTRGQVTVAGYDCVREAEQVRRHVVVIGHGVGLYEDLTARENLKFWTGLAGRLASPHQVATALADLDLERWADERVRTYSAGMKRRLALARLALLPPRVLLLDEPFASLDQRAKKWLEEHLQAFKASGGAIVMATHSFGRELGVADRVAVLAAGAIALDVPRASLSPEELARLYALHTENDP